MWRPRCSRSCFRKCSVGLVNTVPSINGWEAQERLDGCRGSQIPLLTVSETHQAPFPHPFRGRGQTPRRERRACNRARQFYFLARLTAQRKPRQRVFLPSRRRRYAGASWGVRGCRRLPLPDRDRHCGCTMAVYLISMVKVAQVIQGQ